MLIAKDLEDRKGKLFDFSKGKCLVNVTEEILSSNQKKKSEEEPHKSGRNTAGPEWFHMQTPELTPEVERDLRMIRLRAYMDPKKFMKRDDYASKKLPEHFQLGTVVAGLGEKTLKKKQRFSSITQEILANDRVKEYARRVFEEVNRKSLSGGKKSYKRKQNKLAGRFNKKRLI